MPIQTACIVASVAAFATLATGWGGSSVKGWMMPSRTHVANEEMFKMQADSLERLRAGLAPPAADPVAAPVKRAVWINIESGKHVLSGDQWEWVCATPQQEGDSSMIEFIAHMSLALGYALLTIHWMMIG
jgi:hypothetical protein